MASHPISSDSKELEQALRGLDPAALDPGFLTRLEDAAEGDLIALSTAEIQFEKSLRGHAPQALAPDFLLRLQSAVEGLEFAVDEKILLFPKTAPVTPRPAARRPYPAWATAAAVALIGAAAALFMPAGKTAGPAAQNARNTPLSTPVLTPQDPHYHAASFDRVLGEVTDEGVSWSQSDTPHRVVRVTYLDRLTFKDEEGKIIETKQPRTEYIFMPEKTD